MALAIGAVLAAAVGLEVGCGWPGPDNPAAGAPSVPVPSSTPPPPVEEAGEVLFDGRSVRGLRGYGMAVFPEAAWSVDGGRLVTVPGRPVDLITTATYGSVQIVFRWGVAPGGNSGVMYRVIESGDPPWASGPEYQLLDDARHPDGRDPRTSTAAVYGLLAPEVDPPIRAAGEENESRVVIDGDCVEHWLNGRRVVRYDWHDPEFRRRIQASKFRDWPRFMSSEHGAVVFQHHGELAWFSWIAVRRIDRGGDEASC